MKKLCILGIAAVILSFSLTACYLWVPETVTIDGTAYRSGFYGNLFPVNMTYGSDIYTVNGTEFRRVICDHYNWMHTSNGTAAGGTIYCDDSQWAQAKAYYEDAGSFMFYCKVGVENVYEDRQPVIVDLSEEIDPLKFDTLMEFAASNSYDPFDTKKNESVETIRLPIPDSGEAPRLVFYKESKDGYFTSDKSYQFYIAGGNLLLVFYYDYGHGEYEELAAVEVPDELGQYFIELLAQYAL